MRNHVSIYLALLLLALSIAGCEAEKEKVYKPIDLESDEYSQEMITSLKNFYAEPGTIIEGEHFAAKYVALAKTTFFKGSIYYYIEVGIAPTTTLPMEDFRRYLKNDKLIDYFEKTESIERAINEYSTPMPRGSWLSYRDDMKYAMRTDAIWTYYVGHGVLSVEEFEDNLKYLEVVIDTKDHSETIKVDWEGDIPDASTIDSPYFAEHPKEPRHPLQRVMQDLSVGGQGGYY